MKSSKNDKTKYKFINNLTQKLEDIIIDFMGNDTYAIGGVMENRFLYNRLIEIIKDNPKTDKPNIFLDYIKINYVTTVIVAICRQVDKDHDSVSLLNFLYKIYNNAEKITKEWFASQYKEIERGNTDFKKNFGNLTYIDPCIVCIDICNLICCTREIKKLRNKRVAHLNKKKEIKFDIDFDKLNKAVDLIKEIIIKYYLLLNQAGMNDLLPSGILCFRNDNSDEENIFCVPWKECK